MTDPTQWHVHPAKTHISLSIWLEILLSGWRRLVSLATIKRMPSLSWVHRWAASWWNQQNGMCVQRTRISLGIRPVWSVSSLSAWRKVRWWATYWAHSKDSDQTGWILSWGGSGHFIGFVVLQLIYEFQNFIRYTFNFFIMQLLLSLNIFVHIFGMIEWQTSAIQIHTNIMR